MYRRIKQGENSRHILSSKVSFGKTITASASVPLSRSPYYIFLCSCDQLCSSLRTLSYSSVYGSHFLRIKRKRCALHTGARLQYHCSNGTLVPDTEVQESRCISRTGASSRCLSWEGVILNSGVFIDHTQMIHEGCCVLWNRPATSRVSHRLGGVKFNVTPNGERKKTGPVRSWSRVKILTPCHLCENPNSAGPHGSTADSCEQISCSFEPLSCLSAQKTN